MATEAEVHCPVCKKGGNYEYFDDSSVLLTCGNCGSEIEVTEYALTVDIHKIEVRTERRDDLVKT